MSKSLLENINEAGTSGIVAGELYGNARFTISGVGVTNQLAALRASNEVTTRREVRDGERVVVYYSVASAPEGTPRGGRK